MAADSLHLELARNHPVAQACRKACSEQWGQHASRDRLEGGWQCVCVCGCVWLKGPSGSGGQDRLVQPGLILGRGSGGAPGRRGAHRLRLRADGAGDSLCAGCACGSCSSDRSRWQGFRLRLLWLHHWRLQACVFEFVHVFCEFVLCMCPLGCMHVVGVRECEWASG